MKKKNIWNWHEKAGHGWKWLEYAMVCANLALFSPLFCSETINSLTAFPLSLLVWFPTNTPPRPRPPPIPCSSPVLDDLHTLDWICNISYFNFLPSAIFLLYPASPPLPSPSLTFVSSSVLISPSLSRSNKANASCRTKWDTALNLPLYSALQAADKRIIIEEEKS